MLSDLCVLQHVICQGSHLAQNRTANFSLFRRLAGRGLSLRGFPCWWALQFAISGSMPDLTRLSASKKRRLSIRMWTSARHLVVPLLYRPMAWAKSSHIDANTASWRYRYDLPHFIADQIRYMITSHVPCSGRWLHLEDLINPVCSLPHEYPNDDTWKMLFLLLHIHVGSVMLFNHLE